MTRKRPRESKTRMHFIFMAFMHCLSSFTPVVTAYNNDFIIIYIRIELFKKISWKEDDMLLNEATLRMNYLNKKKSLPWNCVSFHFAWICWDWRFSSAIYRRHYGSNIVAVLFSFGSFNKYMPSAWRSFSIHGRNASELCLLLLS